jgi:Mrp family chromosome partitioning ATPase
VAPAHLHVVRLLVAELGQADVLAFTPQLDALLLVVEDGKTTEPELQQAMQILKGSVPILGTVLNKIGRDQLCLSQLKRMHAGNEKQTR